MNFTDPNHAESGGANPIALKDVIATLRGLAPKDPVVGSIAVASDVWEALRSAVPIVRGSSVSFGDLLVRCVPALPPGHYVLCDRDGKPLLKPRANGSASTLATDKDRKR